MATGESSVARALAKRLGAVRLEADGVHDDLLWEPTDERVQEAQWWRSFAHGFEDAVYAELRRRADEYLATGHGVILDGCFTRAHQRLQARALARARGQRFLFVECRVPVEAARTRLLAGDAELEHPVWQAIYNDLAERWEPAAQEHVVVESDGVMEDVLAPGLARLSGGVACARVLGMTSIRIRQIYDDPGALPDADHVVDSHAGLLSLLAELGVIA